MQAWGHSIWQSVSELRARTRKTRTLQAKLPLFPQQAGPGVIESSFSAVPLRLAVSVRCGPAKPDSALVRAGTLRPHHFRIGYEKNTRCCGFRRYNDVASTLVGILQPSLCFPNAPLSLRSRGVFFSTRHRPPRQLHVFRDAL